jgi:hypothetical protein
MLARPTLKVQNYGISLQNSLACILVILMSASVIPNQYDGSSHPIANTKSEKRLRYLYETHLTRHSYQSTRFDALKQMVKACKLILFIKADCWYEKRKKVGKAK